MYISIFRTRFLALIKIIEEGVVHTYIDETAKWKTRELRQINTSDQVGMGRKSRQCTTYIYSSIQLSVHTDWISCIYLAQFPRLPFCGLIYIELLHLWLTSCSAVNRIFSLWASFPTCFRLHFLPIEMLYEVLRGLMYAGKLCAAAIQKTAFPASVGEGMLWSHFKIDLNSPSYKNFYVPASGYWCICAKPQGHPCN